MASNPENERRHTPADEKGDAMRSGPATATITVRRAEEIYQAEGEIENGTFHGRWHSSFGDYYDPRYERFGTLRVFNDDTLSPGAVWPLHPHREIEVVTYCAAGEFRHADQRGVGGILLPGWVQHTTVGRGMSHSELNNRPDEPMRFIQMWFLPAERGLPPSVEQRQVDKEERTNKLLLLVSNENGAALPLASDAKVYSCFLEQGKAVTYPSPADRGGYLYVVEGGDIAVAGETLHALDAAMLRPEGELALRAEADAELLLVIVPLPKSF
jgi:redox-sensitive bicupin YhaK (pirin superfamily)